MIVLVLKKNRYLKSAGDEKYRIIGEVDAEGRKLPLESESFRAQVTCLSSLLGRFQKSQLFLLYLISNLTVDMLFSLVWDLFIKLIDVFD